MKTILATFLILLLLIPVSAIGEIQTITHTVKQPFGGSQSPDDARIAAVAKAKREALEMAGTYIESLTVVKNSHVDKDEILALAAGVLKAEVVSQKNYVIGDAFGIEVIVKVVVDTSILESRVKKLLQDRTLLDQLNQARAREKELLEKIAVLERENRKGGKSDLQQANLKKEFRDASRGLTAVDWSNKAVALWANGKFTDPPKAIEYLNEAIRLRPDDMEDYVLRGVAYANLGQHKRAILDYDKVIRLKPNFVVAYAARGHAYVDLGQYQRAIKDYNKAIRLESDFAGHYGNRGNAYANLGQYQRAIQDYDKAINLKPVDANACLGRGMAYKELGQYQRAIQDYDKAIRLKPDFADAYVKRGNANAALGKHKQSIDDYIIAARLGHETAQNYLRSQEIDWTPEKLPSTTSLDKLPRNPEKNSEFSSSAMSPDKTQQKPVKKIELSTDADQPYRNIKAIVLKNGTVIEGQIISMDPDTVRIRTKDGKALSYDFKNDVQRFITE